MRTGARWTTITSVELASSFQRAECAQAQRRCRERKTKKKKKKKTKKIERKKRTRKIGKTASESSGRERERERAGEKKTGKTGTRYTDLPGKIQSLSAFQSVMLFTGALQRQNIVSDKSLCRNIGGVPRLRK